jgi:Carbohydrate esterase, sialic acid-specific acetylesterase
MVPAETVSLSTPLPFQVFQREGFDPIRSEDHEPGGPRRGFADVPVSGRLPTEAPGSTLTFEYRVTLLPHAFGLGNDWTSFPVEREAKQWSGFVRIPAGGWYELEIRGVANGRTVLQGSVKPMGVGEVFLISGQSYAAGASDELSKIEDPDGRVVTFDEKAGLWRVANDPPPGDPGGSVWPTVGNLLLPIAQVPIAFVNVATESRSSQHWLPDHELFGRVAQAGKRLRRFRAFLWQQGEHDVIEKTSTEQYVKNLLAIRAALAKEWQHDVPWLLAKSTIHPTVYSDPVGEGRIRAAIQELWGMPGFGAGPDTDLLAGENRGGPGSRRHYSAIGQHHAGLMWFAVIWQELNRQAATAE